MISKAAKEQDEGSNGGGIAGDKPAEGAGIGDFEMVVDDVDKVQRLAQRDLGRELSEASDSDEEDLAGEGEE